MQSGNHHSPTFGIAGGGKMGELMRSLDWAVTPVGPPEHWPLSLKTAVRTLLECKLPMYIAWGPEFIQFYNDAYRPILGNKHPDAMGKSVTHTWPEIWPTIGPMFAEVKQGKSLGFDNFVLTIERFGYPEDCYFDFSYSPAPDDNGDVAGVLVTFAETTKKVLLESRLTFQLELANELSTISDPEKVKDIASERLGNKLKAGRVGYGEIDVVRSEILVRQDWTNGSMATLAGEKRPLDSFGPNIIAELKAGRTLQIEDVASDTRSSPYAAGYASIGTQSLIVVPLIREGALVAVLYVHESEARRWIAHDVAMAEDAAARTWADVERARSQLSLQTERDRSHRILESMTEGFALLDHEYRVLQMNAEALRYEKRPITEILGKTHWDAWPGTEYSNLGTMYKKAMEQRAPENMEHVYKFPDGRELWLAVDAYPVPEGLALFYRDVTQSKQAEETLRLANRRKDEFLAMLAHELRNPLAPISAAADLLKLPIGDEGLKRTSAIIARQVHHMTSLVDDLLDVSRVTRGLVKLETAPVDLNTVISHSVEQVRPLFDRKAQKLSLHLARESIRVVGDQKRLVQVMTNLLNNAAKYTPEGGNITLCVEALKSEVSIVVTDDGIGMTQELVASAFELFSQAERSADRSQGGLGLGLALVKSIVELHGGRVGASSHGAGLGSEFNLTFPRLIEANADGNSSQPLSEVVRSPSKPLRLLVVDDNADAALMLSMFLETLGHAVVTENHPWAALKRASSQEFDAVILDIGLPGMDGHELARRIRQAQKSPPVLIAVTGYGAVEDIAAAKDAGFDHHLVKPVSTVILAGLLEKSNVA